MDLQAYTFEITCFRCGGRYSFQEFCGKPVTTKIFVTEGKEWLNKYHAEGDRERKIRSKKMKIKEQCPKCGNPDMLHYTAQTRSADEGSTVFYECPQCHYTYTHNN